VTHVSAAGEGLDLAPLRMSLSRHGILVGARRIRPGDEAASPDPAGPSTPSTLSRRRASGAARIAARALLRELDSDADAALPRSRSGAPLWPEGIVGALAHDDAFAVAAAARRADIAGLGVDVEPAEPLPDDLVDHVLADAERRMTADGVTRRLLFVCKEAVYKAIHPIDGTPLEFLDIAIEPDIRAALLRDGRRLRLEALSGLRLVAVAFIPASASKSASWV
jgi:4'-phosphopantetheinyl transferase EntD